MPPSSEETRRKLVDAAARGFAEQGVFTASLLDPALKRNEAAAVPTSMRHAFQDQLERAKLRAGVDAGQEALVLLVVVTGLSQGVLDGQITAAEAFTTIDYALDRAIRG